MVLRAKPNISASASSVSITAIEYAQTWGRAVAPNVDLQLVIFDCDGVLVDSEVISNRVLAAMLTEQGLPTTLPQARRDYQGLLLMDVRARVEAKLGRSLPPDWLARYEDARADAFRRELAPVAGAAETVECLCAAGLGVCVASQGKIELWRYRHNANYVARRVVSRQALRIVTSEASGTASVRCEGELGTAEDRRGSSRGRVGLAPWHARFGEHGLWKLLDDIEQFGSVVAALAAELNELDRLG